VAPDKHSIYREHVPDHAQGPGDGPSRMDQLLDHLGSRSTVPVVDLRNPLKAAKARFQIYSKWDTHWNAHGAFVAYSQVSEWIGRAFGTPAKASLRDYAIRRARRPGDLGRILGVADYLVEEVPVFEPKAPTGCDLSEYNEGQAEGASFMTRCPAPGPPRKILVFRDSFANALVPFLAREAAEVKFVWRMLPDLAAIERDKPELVIFEIVERHLMRPSGWLKR
jgi:alginate O-acetyltransferase complex protein AlgJ